MNRDRRCAKLRIPKIGEVHICASPQIGEVVLGRRHALPVSRREYQTTIEAPVRLYCKSAPRIRLSVSFCNLSYFVDVIRDELSPWRRSNGASGEQLGGTLAIDRAGDSRRRSAVDLATGRDWRA
jgi:hypothetical protein